MMSQDLTNEGDLYKRNRALLNRIKQIKNDINNLESQKFRSNGADYLPDSTSLEVVFKPINEYEDESMETVAELTNHQRATEELLGIKFVSYSTQGLTDQRLPPGKWIEVTANVLILGFFQVSICFVENAKKSRDPVLSLKWSIRGKLEQIEVEPLNEIIRNDLPSLFCKLKEYAELSQDRESVLNEFYHKYNEHCNFQATKDGMILMWRGLFRIVWLIKLCPDKECFENNIILELNENEREFIKISRGIFEDLINKKQTASEKENTLKALGIQSVQYCNQISGKNRL